MVEGVIARACCDRCRDDESHENVAGHFACQDITDLLREAETAGIVERRFDGNAWRAVVLPEFWGHWNYAPETVFGWGEEESDAA